MKNEGLLTDKKGLTPVVASVILCGVVLAVSVSVWSFTYTVSSGLQESYYKGIKEQIDAVSERFTVEHIAYHDGELRVWIYNYGDVSIKVDVYVRGDVEGGNATGTPIPAGETARIDVSLTASGGDELSVTIMSRRQNVIYAAYVVPF